MSYVYLVWEEAEYDKQGHYWIATMKNGDEYSYTRMVSSAPRTGSVVWEGDKGKIKSYTKVYAAPSSEALYAVPSREPIQVGRIFQAFLGQLIR